MAFPTTPIARLPNHGAPVHALTFSAGTGQYLLTGSQDRQIRLFNPLTGKLIQKFSAHGYGVLDLAVADDNARFASVGGDKTVFLWDVATAQTLRRFQGHAGRVNAVAFGGEGDAAVVSGSFDGTVKVWDGRSRDGRAIMTFAEARDAVSAVAVLGGFIIAGSVDGRVRCYDLGTGRVETDVMGGSGVTSVCPTKKGDAVLVSTLDSRVRLMDRGSGQCLQTFKDDGEEGFVNEAYRIRSTLGMADSVAISGSEDGRVLVWDVLTGAVRERLWHKKGGAGAGEEVEEDVGFGWWGWGGGGMGSGGLEDDHTVLLDHYLQRSHHRSDKSRECSHRPDYHHDREPENVLLTRFYPQTLIPAAIKSTGSSTYAEAAALLEHISRTFQLATSNLPGHDSSHDLMLWATCYSTVSPAMMESYVASASS
ncbi:hypothetical protein LTR78_000100 [Recurvomyces mirabilis]|uniref:WD40 repeat-like protein n=1 Tax=Recurvomyces mirabilis TaxID=574656 RepID=A0AAE0WXA3_9PEZI|nr:hypothetical protein LTR78_000100 [Recurvomyces mirabilis]KAK5161757.1 hypothetical protein LTS14_000102 [Recurvomyces mirabilis]